MITSIDKLLGCTRSQLLILLIIEINSTDGKYEVSFNELSRLSGINLRAVTDSVSKLLTAGLINKVDQGGCDGRSNIYGVCDGG